MKKLICILVFMFLFSSCIINPALWGGQAVFDFMVHPEIKKAIEQEEND